MHLVADQIGNFEAFGKFRAQRDRVAKELGQRFLARLQVVRLSFTPKIAPARLQA